MRSTYLIVTVLVAVALLLAGCGPTPTPVPTIAPATDTPAVAATDTPAAVVTNTPAMTATPAATDTPAMTNTPGGATATAAPTQMPPSGPATVAVAMNTKLGSILVDSKGMTLYLFTKDTPNTSTCTGKCATTWPPLLTKGAPIAGTGADSTKLGTTMRADGTTQVTYNGWPLYYFAKDMQAGDTNGQNVGSVWFVVSPAGAKITQ